MTAQDHDRDTAGAASEGPPPFLCKPGPFESPFVFAVPHSGRYYPQRMRRLSRLTEHSLRLSEDAFVDQLFEGTTGAGATVLVATHARAYLDLNRAHDELDPFMFTPPLDEATVQETHRVKAGLGLIPRVVAENMPIYDKALPAREAFSRIEQVYHPYHQQLSSLLGAKRQIFGQAVVIDCHSMPSESKPPRRRGRTSGPEIVLGDNWGSACARELTSFAEELLIRSGFSVRRNVPYSGGFTTQHYGVPGRGIHALQIEICRSIYMDEETLKPLPCFDDIQQRFQWFSEKLMEKFGDVTGMPKNAPHQKAAE